ncbi:tumor necrosis factor receptor superfamily member 14 isoform X2 [Neoarius graeffei]|uniref:tumor necrosis factor receptor superfamily member 14 isoform X2 n=1 Tax=Neoarius graeffei TaxID=443677 RepID=UPI00298C6485|nr:tumor necrosis factor receptor superfamily member 14 isoform X2 [Neoarius graeffei]
MSVKVLHVVIFILMSGPISSLPLETETRRRRSADVCTDCPAGTFMSQCNKCETCPNETFTNKPNKERSCLDCFKDCLTELHLQVVSPCSTVADVVCECMKGYVCNKTDRYTGQCVRCTRQPPSQTYCTTIAQTPSYAPEQTTSPPPPWTTHTSVSPQPFEGNLDSQMQLLIVVFALCIFCGIITCCCCKQRKIDCLKKRLKQCSVRQQKEVNKAISSEINKPIPQLCAQDTHIQTPSTANADCPTPEPGSREQPLPASGNLGPLHIYGAGTVFVSLLNQFGLNRGDKDEDDLRQQPLNSSEMHSPPSPTIPLSKEERNRDTSLISYPSQEQGKECHMSKEEGL